jgi:hypothetical protein
MGNNRLKEYFKNNINLTDIQLDRLWGFYEEHVICEDLEDYAPMRKFSIEYQFSTIGVAIIAKFGDKKLWINEEECNP